MPKDKDNENDRDGRYINIWVPREDEDTVDQIISSAKGRMIRMTKQQVLSGAIKPGINKISQDIL